MKQRTDLQFLHQCSSEVFFSGKIRTILAASPSDRVSIKIKIVLERGGGGRRGGGGGGGGGGGLGLKTKTICRRKGEHPKHFVTSWQRTVLKIRGNR